MWVSCLSASPKAACTRPVHRVPPPAHGSFLSPPLCYSGTRLLLACHTKPLTAFMLICIVVSTPGIYSTSIYWACYLSGIAPGCWKTLLNRTDESHCLQGTELLEYTYVFLLSMCWLASTLEVQLRLHLLSKAGSVAYTLLFRVSFVFSAVRLSKQTFSNQ